MFGIILLAAVVIGGGYIVVTESNKTTADKLKPGDAAFVNASSIAVGSSADDAQLKAFLAGFMAVTVRVSNVVADTTKKLGHGTIIGFGPTVSFPLDAIASIDRNGTRIV